MTANDTSISTLFLEFSQEKLLQQYWPRLRTAVEPLTDQQVWWRPNDACNSIGNLILHLNGNVGQWLVASFNRTEDHRERPAEFNATEGLSAGELLDRLGATMDRAAAILARLTPDDLVERFEVQGYEERSGLELVYQVVKHFGLHYGQILYIVKTVRAEDLGFYRELNQTGRASGGRSL